MEEGRTALPALCASCTGCLLEARSTGPHACWGIGFIMPLKWRVFIYLILYVIHLIVNGLRQLMYISKAARAQSPLCCLLTGISPPHFHIYTDAVLTDDDNRDCTIHVPRLLLLLLRSNILTRGLIRTIIISFVRAFHTKCFLIFPLQS